MHVKNKPEGDNQDWTIQRHMQNERKNNKNKNTENWNDEQHGSLIKQTDETDRVKSGKNLIGDRGSI